MDFDKILVVHWYKWSMLWLIHIIFPNFSTKLWHLIDFRIMFMLNILWNNLWILSNLVLTLIFLCQSMVNNKKKHSGGVSYGPRQANLVLIAYASSEGSGEPAHPRSLARTFAAHLYKQWIKRNLETESQIPGPAEWLGMCSWNLSWRNAQRHKFAWRGSCSACNAFISLRQDLDIADMVHFEAKLATKPETDVWYWTTS